MWSEKLCPVECKTRTNSKTAVAADVPLLFSAKKKLLLRLVPRPRLAFDLSVLQPTAQSAKFTQALGKMWEHQFVPGTLNLTKPQKKGAQKALAKWASGTLKNWMLIYWMQAKNRSTSTHHCFWFVRLGRLVRLELEGRKMMSCKVPSRNCAAICNTSFKRTRATSRFGRRR